MKRKSRGDRVYQVVINVIAVLIGIITLYPLIYTLSASLSQPIHILSGEVVLWPVELTLNSYRRVFASADILNGYKNTIFYSVGGHVPQRDPDHHGGISAVPARSEGQERHHVPDHLHHVLLRWYDPVLHQREETWA